MASIDIVVMEEAVRAQIIHNVKTKLDNIFEEIKKEDPDCIYNGVGYRKIILDFEQCYDLLCCVNQQDYTMNKNEMLQSLKNEIYMGDLRSFTTSLENCISWRPMDQADQTDSALVIIIEQQIKDGIYVYGLLKKYEKIAEELLQQYDKGEYVGEHSKEELQEIYDSLVNMDTRYGFEKEVLKETDESCEIVQINDTKVSSLDETIAWNDLFLKYGEINEEWFEDLDDGEDYDEDDEY